MIIYPPIDDFDATYARLPCLKVNFADYQHPSLLAWPETPCIPLPFYVTT
ncbi:MAG: hypothetical protein AB8B62_18070 [Roseobacter sp.]